MAMERTGLRFFSPLVVNRSTTRRLEQQRPNQQHLGLPVDGSVGIDLAGAEWLVEAMVPKLDPSICATCKLRVFLEYKNMPDNDLPDADLVSVAVAESKSAIGKSTP